MGELADSMIYGSACSKCLAPIQDEELVPAKIGVPVVCQYCWNVLEEEKKRLYSKVDIPQPWVGNSFSPTSFRTIRNDRFEEEWLQRFMQKLGSNFYYDSKKFCYTINPIEGITTSVIDFYPKANKLLIRKENKWVKPALRWLIAEFSIN